MKKCLDNSETLRSSPKLLDTCYLPIHFTGKAVITEWDESNHLMPRNLANRMGESNELSPLGFKSDYARWPNRLDKSLIRDCTSHTPHATRTHTYTRTTSPKSVWARPNMIRLDRITKIGNFWATVVVYQHSQWSPIQLPKIELGKTPAKTSGYKDSRRCLPLVLHRLFPYLVSGFSSCGACIRAWNENSTARGVTGLN